MATALQHCRSQVLFLHFHLCITHSVYRDCSLPFWKKDSCPLKSYDALALGSVLKQNWKTGMIKRLDDYLRHQDAGQIHTER